jgi:hypothetical protein
MVINVPWQLGSAAVLESRRMEPDSERARAERV